MTISYDESAGVQNTVVMWAVVPPGGGTGGSWLLVLQPGGRTCSILSDYGVGNLCGPNIFA